MFHPQHGHGIVTSHDGKTATVRFKSGATHSFETRPGKPGATAKLSPVEGGGVPEPAGDAKPATYRERRAARAERLRGWAGKREVSSAAALKAADPFRGDTAFNTQPGHIPERARMIAREDRARASAAKAAAMRSRAAGIDGQLASSIYSDDPDAVKQLRERITRLEAEREQAKAVNAAYRKKHKAELDAIDSAFLRNQALPYPSYHFQNLSGNLSRQRERLAKLEREQRRASGKSAQLAYSGG